MDEWFSMVRIGTLSGLFETIWGAIGWCMILSGRMKPEDASKIKALFTKS